MDCRNFKHLHPLEAVKRPPRDLYTNQVSQIAPDFTIRIICFYLSPKGIRVKTKENRWTEFGVAYRG